MKYYVVLAAVLIMSSCQKNSSDKSSPASPPSNQQQGNGLPVTPGNPPPATPPPGPSDSSYPTATFEYNEFSYDGSGEVHLHIILSAASTEAIALDMSLIDGTATYPRDYAGFTTGGNARAQTVVLEPGERMTHHYVGIPQTAVCGGNFFIKLSAGPGAKVKLGPQANIHLKCP